MNSFPVQQQYPQPQTQPQQAPGIDPSLLASFRSQIQAGGNSSGNVNGNKFPYGGGMGGGGAFNPQMMQQNSQGGGGGGTLNLAHLMNGAGHHQQQHQTVNPQQMFHQSHQQQQQQHGMMNGGMGISPTTLNSNHLPTTQHPLAGLTREQMQQHYNSLPPQQQQILQAKMANAQAAISQQQHQQQQHHHAQQQQFQSHSHSGLQQQQQQQQNPAAQQHALQQILAQQQHQHQQAAYFGDRPSSSASSQPQMMPPPTGIPPRPPTTGPGPSSRPGTSHSHGSASQAGLPGGQMQMQRPPSRPTTAAGFDGQQQQHQYPMANGNWNPNQPKPMTPQQTHFGQQMQAASSMQQQQQYHQQQQQHHQQHSPPPGSPYRGAKRKVANGMGMDSPRMGNPAMMGSQMGSQMSSGMNMGGVMMSSSMGPPGMARQISSNSTDQPQAQQQNIQQNYPAMVNGFPQQSQSQQQHQSQSTPSGMRPRSSNGHIPTTPHTPMHSGGGGSGGMSAMLNDPTRMNGMGSIPGGMNMGGLGSNMGLMGMSGGNDTLPRTPQRSAPSGQIPGYPALGSTMPTQHRQPSTPAFSPQLPGLQQSMMQSHGSKPSLVDQTANMGMKMGGLPQLNTSGFTGLDSRPAGLPSRIPSAAPTQPINSSMAAIKQTPPTPGIQPVLAPLPANVQLNHQVTRVTVVPLAGSDKTIPSLSQSEIEDIQTWKQADKDYEGIWRKMKERMADELRTATGPSKAAWWEKDAVDLTRRKPREPFDVRYPRQKRDRDGRDRRKTGRREGLKLPRKLTPEDANRPEQLVPIRLEFEVEHHKMRDSFVWNLNDPVVTPEAFAQSVVEDYSLAPSYHSVITKSIQDQLSDFRIHSENPDGDIDEADVDIVKGELDEEDAAWWESWRKRLRTARGFVKSSRRHTGVGRKRKRILKGGSSVADRPMDVDDIEIDETQMHEDMRILIKLDIIVGSTKLEDQFEWDLDNVNASPEMFAEVYGADLGLTGEYITAISHSIREQVQMYQKSLFLVGHPSDGSAIQDEDLRMSFLPSLSSGARSIDQVGSFTPLLNYLSDGDIERNEKEREKELNKRRKRNTRGRRGVPMPDREPIRTHRTPAIGFPELDPSTLAAAVAASAPTSRRAAAAAASLTIANMVASENGTLHMPQTTPLVPQPPPSSSKEKKPKGLFKAPTYPPSILRPRARVSAPTPSTAAESSSLSLPVDPDAPVSTRSATADSRASKVITAKRAKELEREAKEKEYADGQHANMIDGVWHCSNCGCPEDIAVGRRKGPLGDKSQCGTCGKYWHRHRRPMAVEYNSSAEYHTNKLREAELARTMARRRGGAAALRAQNAGAATPGEDGEAASSPQNEGESEPPPRQSQQPTVPPSEDDRAASPASSTSSDSEPPLAQRVSKANGSNHANSVTPAPTSSGPVATQASPQVSPSAPATVSVSVPPTGATPTDPPKWLWAATQSMRSKYPDDTFILKRINGTEWRIKCSDCPGKLYTPGPGETLSNYEVHLKNRQHRQRVNDRVNGMVQQPS